MRKSIYIMEFMLQTIILFRIVMTLAQPYINKQGWGWFVWMVFYFIFSELGPFMILAWQIHKKSRPQKFR